jgi:glutathione S-transferase
MSIELFVFPPSPRAFKVLAVANHLGLPYEMKLVNLVKGEQRAPEYVALNANMKMPTLRDGDFVLWESNAIVQYLAAQRPQSGLLPEETRGRLDVTRWQFWDLAHWDPACAGFIFEYLVKPVLLGITDGPDKAALARSEEQFHRSAAVLDAQLRGRTYVTGDTLTLADFVLAAPLNVAEIAHIPIAPYAEIKRWFATMSALPAWQKTLAQSAPQPAKAA